MMVTMAMNDEFFSDAAFGAGIGGSIYSYLKRGFRMESRNPNSAPHPHPFLHDCPLIVLKKNVFFLKKRKILS